MTDEETRYAVWAKIFVLGRYDDILRTIGVPNETSYQQCEKVWKGEFGRRFMREWLQNVTREVPWALGEFGEPD
jgi:hypothetical protein